MLPALLLGCAFGPVMAAEFPSERPVNLVVPFAPGGGTDILARMVAAKLGERLRQTVTVDNKPGANGLIAMQFVERAKADGYTLLFGSSSTHVLAPLLSAGNESMEKVRERFSLVGIVADTPQVFAVKAGSGPATLAEFAKAAGQREFTYGTFGAGSTPHLLGQQLAKKLGVRLLHVAYKGSAPAVTDLLGGHVDSVFLTVAGVSAQIADGQVRPLAVTGPRRVQSLPTVPTFKEAGIAGFERSGWFALFAPAGIPAAVGNRLGRELRGVMALSDVRGQLRDLGLEPTDGDPAQEQKTWDQTIRDVRQSIGELNFSGRQ